MERLFTKSIRKISQAPMETKRYLYDRINLKNRLIAIKGARGTGKTTLLLQLAKQWENGHLPSVAIGLPTVIPVGREEVLYVALDDLFFTGNGLYELAERFFQTGGKKLLLDEVHKYPNWSREIKLIYDDFPELQLIFTSSSILDIYKGESDLSRRVVSYHLNEMSFREFLMFNEALKLPSYSLEEILINHQKITLELTNLFKPLKFFPNYLKYGAYPYFDGNIYEYHQQMMNTINLIMDIDLQGIENIDYQKIAQFKKLLFVIASNVPFIPNISKISEKIGTSRNTMAHAFLLLEKAQLVHSLRKQTRSIGLLNKPDKIWLRNTNLNYAISENLPDKGTLRETFFLSQLSLDHNLSLPERGDFLVNKNYTFEIGGRNKSQKQIAEVSNAYLVKDDLENGAFNTIPLWLFGFLY